MKATTRDIAHMDLDTFFVSCQYLIDSSLIGKPVIIGGSSDRGVVSSCSYEARYFGVHSAMPMKHALQRCPDAVIVRGDMDFYSKKSSEVTQVIKESAPVYEKSSIDEFYLDVSGMDRFYDTYKWTTELVTKINTETGLPISFGLSGNKTVAKMATTESKPKGKLQISHDVIQQFLNPLSVSKIPMVGNKTKQELFRIGIKKIQTLSQTPVEFLEQLFGKNGRLMYQKANGIDHSPIVQDHEANSISKERSFDRDTLDLKGVQALLSQFVEDLCYKLRKDQKVCSKVTVKIRYSNFDTYTKQCSFAYTGSDQVVLTHVKTLFEKLFERRMRIRLIGVKLSGLVNGAHQISLFDENTEEIALLQAMDKLKNRFGTDVIRSASGFNALSKNNQA
ncbi:DNA polymerase IV [Cyclobacteriaceae bacterium]|nr:DNA polymerase IV [Cyclobacteriaceae bacterium]